MKKDEIISMAREAGIPELYIGAYYGAIERFATLAASHEREECAKVCETHMEWGEINPTIAIAAGNCADLIRARGDK